MPTVLITGCSTGFGREIALHFAQLGWDVVATMRDPSASTLPASDRMRVLPLDVTDVGSIAAAVEQAGPIDVLVNNAGIGWLNAVEGTSLAMVRQILETNVVSIVATMQAVLPGMRARGAGVIVNVSSSVTYRPLPLLAMYRASKAAVNALTEGAALELAPFGIRTRVVNPGAAPSTSFDRTAHARIEQEGGFPDAYAAFAEQTIAAMRQVMSGDITESAQVAEAVFRAATDPACPMLLPAGADAIKWTAER